MAILVDDARWKWRGTTWCHLVSDSDLDELHTFAGSLGCRRIGFQGDHYDIDVVTRDVAIALGAQPCDSRELVRRIRSAGLRLRPSAFPKWSLLRRWDSPLDPRTLRSTDGLERLDGSFERHLGPVFEDSALTLDGAFALSRGEARALIVYGRDGGPSIEEDATSGRYHRVDHAGHWAIELVDPPLRSTE